MTATAQAQDAATVPKPKRGRKAGSKVPCATWTQEDDARLTVIVEAWDTSNGPKKLLWLDAARQLGSSRTPAGVEQHWYYMGRQQRTKSTTPATCGAAAKTSSRLPAARTDAKAPAAAPAAAHGA